MAPGETRLTRQRERGAFFTPAPIARFLADWAVGNNPDAKILDPTCGEAVFLQSAGRLLQELGCNERQLRQRLFGVDIHAASLDQARRILAAERIRAQLVEADFFDLSTPDELVSSLPAMDAVIGNPPFVRYQLHAGNARKKSASAALRQGVRLSGLASSWAALLVHACGFLKPEGRLAMVLPAELLTVHYAEPIRRWLRRRFAAVRIVMFERLQFSEALEKVVLVVAEGSGGCDAFALYTVDDADDLAHIRPLDVFSVTPTDEGKWTDLLLTVPQRQLFRSATAEHFVSLETLGSPELGTVTGANDYFTLTEQTRASWQIDAADLLAISPPGTRHLRSAAFTKADWRLLRDEGERVWLLHPRAGRQTKGLKAYIAEGEKLGVPLAYKCQVRDPWWRPPAVAAPDLFFTYMSHRFPRVIANTAGVTFLNSMHGIRLKRATPRSVRQALPILALNSVTMVGAELFGRSYGGGILKMEPREAASLPVPKLAAIESAWSKLDAERSRLETQLKDGRWTGVLARVDEVLLRDTLGLEASEVVELHEAARSLRERRLGRGDRPK